MQVSYSFLHLLIFLSGRAAVLVVALARNPDGKEMYISLLTSLHISQLLILQNVLSGSRLDSVPTFHSCPGLSAVQSF